MPWLGLLQALIDFLGGCNMLGVQLTEKALQAYADLIEARIPRRILRGC
jgi:hypothetical protein